MAVPCFRQFDSRLSNRRPGFDHRSLFVRFVTDQVTLGRVFLQVLQPLPASVFPPMLLTHFHPHVTVARRTNGRSLTIFRKANTLSAVREHWT